MPLKRYRLPAWLPRLLFSGVLLWQLLAVSCFGWAIISSVTAGSLNRDLMNAAFMTGSGLWAAFMIADEILQQYDAEHAHVLFFIAQLASFATLYVLPS